jgi:hypothetical protein
MRKLGSGAHSDVFLAVGDVAEPGSAVALKIFRPGTDAPRIAAEVDALARVDAAHCVRLLDFSVTEDRQTVLVLSRVTRGSVARLVSLRGFIGAGEAVTILAPIAAAVDELHGPGVAHGTVGAATVHFGDRGEPVLLGFGHARLFAVGGADAIESGSAATTAGAIEHDRHHLALFAAFVLAAVNPEAPGPGAPQGSRPDVAGLVDWIASHSRPLPASFARDLQDRLYDLVPAVAVSFETRRQPVSASQLRAAANFADSDEPGSAVEPATISATFSGLLPSRAASGTRAVRTKPKGDSRKWVDVALGPAPLAPVFARVRLLLRTRIVGPVRAVRLRFWIAFVIAALAVAAGITYRADAPLVETGIPVEGAVVAEQHTAGAPEPPGRDQNRQQPVGEGGLLDDPLEALPALLTERQRCFVDLSVLCLDAVNQHDSALAAEDSASITQPLKDVALGPAEDDGVEHGEPQAVTGRALEEPFVVTETALVERLGDAALLQFTANGKPASVLMIRTETGWRLRELYGG